MAPVLVAITGLGLAQGALAHVTWFWGENLHNLAQAEVGFFQTYVLGPLLRSGLAEQQIAGHRRPAGGDDAGARPTGAGMAASAPPRAEPLSSASSSTSKPLWNAPGAIRRRPRDVPAIGFLDLSGFTALTELQGDEAAVGLTVELSELVRSTTAQHGGRPVKFLGDGVMCHFPRPQEAVLAALEMVEAAPSARLPAARVGLHAGPVICRDSDYFGRTVNIASRLAAYARPDQVLVTADLRAMTRPAGVRFERLGAVTLKGIASPLGAERGEVRLATSSSTVAEVHDDALISTTPRDAARQDLKGSSCVLVPWQVDGAGTARLRPSQQRPRGRR
jgi:adenylate cyclase